MTKNSYAQFNDVRAYHDKKTDDIHLTIKDPRFKDGFKLTLNAGRKEELALREILEAENKLTPLPVSPLPSHAFYDYHIPNLKSAPQDGEFEGYSYKEISTALKKITDNFHIPIGATGTRRFDNAFWDTDLSQNFLVAAGKKSGLVTFLRSIANYTETYSDKWQSFVIDGGNDKIHSDPKKNITDIEQAMEAVLDLYQLSDPETAHYASNNLDFNKNKRTIIIISNIDKLKPTNPNSWEEIIQYEGLLSRIRLLEGNSNRYAMNIIFASENFTNDEFENIKPFRYGFRMVIGRVPLEVSKFVLGPNNDAGTKIPNIPGRAITIRHDTQKHLYNQNSIPDRWSAAIDATVKDSMKEIQTFDISRD